MHGVRVFALLICAGVKWTVPAIDRYADLNLEIGREKDKGGAKN